MARIFITGSSDGLGLMAAELLASQGHDVVWHARDAARAAQLQARCPAAAQVAIGDLASMAQTRALAAQVDALGHCDAVIHNAAVGYRESRRQSTEDGLAHVFAVNVMAPYLLTALMARPRRLVYLSSGMHRGVSAAMDDLNWTRRPWQGAEAYAESKLLDTMLALAVARAWPEICSNAVEPGWVPTKMGGPGAPDDLQQAHLTQAWLAAGTDPAAKVSGQYFYHLKPRSASADARDKALQQRLLDYCEAVSGVAIG